MRYTLCLLMSLITLLIQAQKPKAIVPHFKTFGKGQPIVIINGGPGMNSDGFATMAQMIADLGYKTIIYDQRGTGKSHLSVTDTNTVTMDLMVADLEALRKKCKFKKWTVLGHSFGGILATHYYAKHPKSIDKLMFSSSGGVNMNYAQQFSTLLNQNLTPLEQDSLAYYTNKINQGDTSQETLRKRAKYLAPAYLFNKQFAPMIAERLLQLNIQINSIVYQNLVKIKFDYTGRFISSKIPVLILQGNRDVISVETAQEIHSSFGNSKLVIMPDCGHYGWLDAKDLYLESILSFMKA